MRRLECLTDVDMNDVWHDVYRVQRKMGGPEPTEKQSLYCGGPSVNWLINVNAKHKRAYYTRSPRGDNHKTGRKTTQ